jgi:hypothetical protein
MSMDLVQENLFSLLHSYRSFHRDGSVNIFGVFNTIYLSWKAENI